jgi:hypothetical protein
LISKTNQGLSRGTTGSKEGEGSWK